MNIMNFKVPKTFEYLYIVYFKMQSISFMIYTSIEIVSLNKSCKKCSEFTSTNLYAYFNLLNFSANLVLLKFLLWKQALQRTINFKEVGIFKGCRMLCCALNLTLNKWIANWIIKFTYKRYHFLNNSDAL